MLVVCWQPAGSLLAWRQLEALTCCVPHPPTAPPCASCLPNPRSCSQARADEIAAHTSLDPAAAAAVSAFFQQGGRQAEPLAGLPGLGGMLPSL